MVDWFNSSPNHIILVWSELKAFANDKSKAATMVEFVAESVGNNVGEGKNAGYQHLLLFPHCFQKALFSRVIKTWDCLVKGYLLSNKKDLCLHSSDG